MDEGLERGLRNFAVYHHPAQLSRPGRYVYRLGMHRCGTWLGFAPIRRLVEGYSARGCSFAALTINDPFLMRLYASAGFNAIGTDDPKLLSRVLSYAH